MRYYFLILFMLASGCLYSQKKCCAFPLESIIVPNTRYSCQLLDTMKSIPFKQYDRKGKIPQFIKKALNCWAGNQFDIANPGWPANIGCSQGLFSFLLPDRELLYLGLAKNYMLMSFKQGTNAVNSPIVLFRFENKKIISVWYWPWSADAIESTKELLEYLEFYTSPPRDITVYF